MEPNSCKYYDLVASELYTAVLADILDELGYRNQVLRHDIRPLYPEAVVVGRAATILSVEVYEVPSEPYKMEMVALDNLRSGDVVVATTNGSTRAGLWGELLSTASRSRGARGAVLDGFTRDTRRIIGMRFPVFCTGVNPADSKGRCEVIAYNISIEVGGVLVRPGDLVVADDDGGVVVPRSAEEEAIRLSLAKVAEEDKVREALRGGMKMTEAFKRFGVL